MCAGRIDVQSQNAYQQQAEIHKGFWGTHLHSHAESHAYADDKPNKRVRISGKTKKSRQKSVHHSTHSSECANQRQETKQRHQYNQNARCNPVAFICFCLPCICQVLPTSIIIILVLKLYHISRAISSNCAISKINNCQKTNFAHCFYDEKRAFLHRSFLQLWLILRLSKRVILHFS